MWAQNQAILPKIGIVLGVVLTCWLLIGVVATRTQPPSTPTVVFGATPVRQPSATVRGGATPTAPITPTVSTVMPSVTRGQPGAAAVRFVVLSGDVQTYFLPHPHAARHPGEHGPPRRVWQSARAQ